MSTYVIGDIHGCYNELKNLLIKINYKSTDTIICAGDIVNKGYNNLDCIFYLMDLNAKVVLGNHDLLLLQLLQNNKSTKSHNLDNILNSDQSNIIKDWLLKQEILLNLSDFNSTIVHAGIYPFWTKKEYLEKSYKVKQSLITLKYDKNAISSSCNNKVEFYSNCFTRMRLLKDDNSLDLNYFKLDSNLTPWYELYDQPETVIFGHWSFLRGKTSNPKAINIDTGCVYGYRLTCIRLEDFKRFYVESNSSKKHQ